MSVKAMATISDNKLMMMMMMMIKVSQSCVGPGTQWRITALNSLLFTYKLKLIVTGISVKFLTNRVRAKRRFLYRNQYF